MVVEPRDVLFFGEPNIAPMKYGPLSRVALPYTSTLLNIRNLLHILCTEQKQIIGCSLPLTALLLNHYRDGRDSMGMHSDVEPTLGPHPFLVSLSLGAERKCIFRNRHSEQLHEIIIQDGTVILMIGASIQHNWKHSIPKTSKPVGERWNLSFRYHLKKNS